MGQLKLDSPIKNRKCTDDNTNELDNDNDSDSAKKADHTEDIGKANSPNDAQSADTDNVQEADK